MTGKQHLPLNRRTTDIVSGRQNPKSPRTSLGGEPASARPVK
jgi:hypothetical protein